MMRHGLKRYLLSAFGVLFTCGANAGPQAAAEAIDFVTWREPNEGAYTIRVPLGWKISGGIRRRTPVDMRSALNVVSPDGVIHLFIGDYDVPPAREPDAATRTAGLREGQVYDGTILARYQTGVGFAQKYPGWKLCRQADIVQSGILRKETETLNAEVAQYGRRMATAASASVGEVIFRCGEAEGFVMATTVVARPAIGPGASVWSAFQLAGFITRDSAQGYFAKYILSSMLASLQMNHDWERRAAQAAGQYAGAMMQLSNAVTQSAVQHARRQAALGSAGGWNHPNTGGVPKITHDPAVEQRRDIANRGSRRVCDDQGTCASVDNSWASVWRNHENKVVPGSSSGRPPDYSGQWTQMK